MTAADPRLILYHGDASVCSQKARVALAEKELGWEGVLLDLSKDDQFAPDYMALNPDAVVPTLVHDGLVVRESSLIIEYVDRLSPRLPLMPSERAAEVATRLWLVRTIAIHEAINAMTFATMAREKEKARSAEETEAAISKLPNPQIQAKRRDLFARGAESVFVDGALHVLGKMLADMDKALAHHKWLTGDDYGLADVALIAYVDRLDRLAMSGLWETRFANVGNWLAASKARPSYDSAILAYAPAAYATTAAAAAGKAAWPAIARRL
jgi:glutathione S-transferase